ncbi:hypothetical protein SIO70_20860 [Chitinophaga sancti]|uniref:hypothetical protein n=1 Tax=Chitinophaga sancti TaxID=1004 RepID=UPI002A758B43|nr:hypothetical protein [Chitinophaga sancti]WPQ60809.1 hypothetical protein SIO70_20860 [Chitinophaga sancti]
MSRSKIFGLLSVVVVIVCTFLPWITVVLEGKELVFTGLRTYGSNFGEPGKVNVFFAGVIGVLFMLKGKMPPRFNLFLAAFLAAWTFRNLLLFSRCEMGVCPDRHIALFLSFVAALGAFVSVLFTTDGKADKKDDSVTI